eukprot:TRINITY_DN8446_c0_g1_i1.p1 TRINITY_DN8446_c0_g1~~TRINITY_DN8446_c0_g1_i1.p1  ORF type:complete len:332 (+),score=45.58 TRINITY_DN8446_c0_g1_i1:89-997(+)
MMKRHAQVGSTPWNPWQTESTSTGGGKKKQGKETRLPVKKETRNQQMKQSGVSQRKASAPMRSDVVVEYDSPHHITLEGCSGNRKETEVDIPSSPALPENASKYDDICLLHSLESGDSLMKLALRYKSTIEIIQDVNQLKMNQDMDTLPPNTVLVVPIGSTKEVLQACMELGSKPEFLELYGSRLTANFRRKRAAPAGVAPPQETRSSTAPAAPSFFDELDDENVAYTDDFSFHSPAPRTGMSSMSGSNKARKAQTPVHAGASSRSASSTVTSFTRSLKAMFSIRGSGSPKQQQQHSRRKNE